MRKIFERLLIPILFVFVFSLIFSRYGFAVSYPEPIGYVNDFAEIYSPAFRSSLESDLAQYEKDSGNEFAVATIKSLEGMDIETYAVELFEKWKIGKKGQDNGLLLLISRDDRNVRIEVGYGLEQYVTDARAGDVIRNDIVPAFQKNDYEGGTLAAVEELQGYISGEIVPQNSGVDSYSETVREMQIFLVGGIFAFFVLSTYLAGYFGRTKESWPGAVLGGVLGGLGGFFLVSALGMIIGAGLFGFMGFFFDYILSKNWKFQKSHGYPTSWGSTWGGFRTGGGSSGGGPPAGGGGFGGGSSGGGGASGRW
ncbi:TPM domain-containing protein [Candidatus Gottesmanbacteria bacterium]|nr:TPM domain-containing protein [Candidatus Gottesmanbacteria bacterium]